MTFLNRLHDDQRGFALEATLMVMLLISVLLAAAVLGAVTTTRTTSMDYRNSRVFYAAEAATEAIMGQLGQDMEDGYLSDEELAALVPPPLQGFTFDSFSVTKVEDQFVETITDGSFAGLYALTQKVEIYSEARDAVDNSSAIMISAKAQAIPIFQFGVFFEKDLEATNGPPMTFSGWVHSNGNIYLSSNNAWYKDAITTPNKVFHDRKDVHTVYDGVYVDDAYNNSVQLLFDSRTHSTPNTFRARSDQDFDNRVKTDAYGVDSLVVPLPAGVGAREVMRPREAGDTDEEKRAKYAWKADMYVVVDLVNLTQRQAVCGANGGSKTPDEVLGNPGVVGLQPVEAGVQINFKIGNNCGWKGGADFEVEVFGDGALMWTGSEDDVGNLCTFNITIPFGIDVLKVVIVDNGGSPFDGTAIWKNLQALLTGTTPWPNITMTRPTGKVVPNIDDLCSIFKWEWSAFYDGREQSMSDIINVDITGLSLWAAGMTDRSSEIVYVEIQAPADVGGYSGAAKALLDDATLDPAVRIVNAAILPNRMSIATDWPLYLRGDYNALAWKPSALVGDAITILSTAWVDSDNLAQAAPENDALETEIWAAILAGHSATPCDHEVGGCGATSPYGGGIENFPRFLEDWSPSYGQQTVIYRGSLVSLDVAQRAVGDWNGSYYDPPNRDWQFDTRFEDPSNLPPGTPVVGVVIRTAFRPVF